MGELLCQKGNRGEFSKEQLLQTHQALQLRNQNTELQSLK